MDLQQYKDQPFVLLQALQQQVLGEKVQSSPVGTETWPGITAKVGDHDLVVAQREVQEIIDLPSYTRVPRSAPWLLGIANVRGELLPIISLKTLITDAPPSLDQSSRVLVLNDGKIPAGFVVDRVEGLRRFYTSEQQQDSLNEAPERLSSFLMGAFAKDDRRWWVLSLRRLVRDPSFQLAA
ncbi:MAG: chemotaxis protein CheW [Salinisphaeraceae bacterium]|nr:chemotaxis protein CheW [Salinisphaeraceae bacterium]